VPHTIVAGCVEPSASNSDQKIPACHKCIVGISGQPYGGTEFRRFTVADDKNKTALELTVLCEELATSD
jgi:hypothetical protein